MKNFGRWYIMFSLIGAGVSLISVVEAAIEFVGSFVILWVYYLSYYLNIAVAVSVA